jgi:excisionase family DNA binding protein
VAEEIIGFIVGCMNENSDTSTDTADPPAVHPTQVYLTKTQIAQHLGVCTRTINNLMNRGLPHVRLGGRLIRFRLADVEKHFEEIDFVGAK